MISRKNLWNLCDKYIREVISGPLGPSDLKYKGRFHWVNEFPLQQYEPMIDPPKPISMSFSVGRIEIETRHFNGSWMYETCVRFIYKNHQHGVAFEIPQEAWSRQALEYHFKEYCRIFEKETGLIKLTPEEESQESYAEAKKKHFAELYGAGNKSVAGLKTEIEQLKTQHPKPVYVVKGPDGNMHVASPDESQLIMHQVMHTAQMAMEAATSEPIFNSLKAMAEQYYKDFGTYPDLETFGGMKKAFEDLEKEVYNEYETDPYMGQHIYQGGHKQGKTVKIGVQGGSFKSPQSYDNAGNELAKIIPALSYRGANCPAPHNKDDARCHLHGQMLSEIIIHLNDSHKWPRSGTDPNPHNLPNIADWIDEVCLIHGLDQSFHPQEEKKPTVRNWAAMKNTKKHGIIGGTFDGA